MSKTSSLKICAEKIL